MMFLGEMSCYFMFKIWYYYHMCKKRDLSQFGPQNFNPLIWAIPAICDTFGTSIMCVGLTWTFAASYQMMRGSVIIFTGLLSVVFLGNELKLHQWIGMFTVVTGLLLVGVGDYVLFQESGFFKRNTVLAGNLLIVLSQVILAIQVTFEEKIIKKYQVSPLHAVGWEGIFGFVVFTTLLFPMYYTPWHLPASPDFWQDTTRFEDAIDGLYQIVHSPYLLVSSAILIVSVAFYNFSLLTVTKAKNATTRTVLDSFRDIFIWAFTLIVGWDKFNVIQACGYLILFTGTCIYYNIIITSLAHRLLAKFRHDDFHIQEQKEPLLSPNPCINA